MAGRLTSLVVDFVDFFVDKNAAFAGANCPATGHCQAFLGALFLHLHQDNSRLHLPKVLESKRPAQASVFLPKNL